ncbi:MAG TPA: DUF5681 domain-containing protein [Rhizomicrobium sp.]
MTDPSKYTDTVDKYTDAVIFSLREDQEDSSMSGDYAVGYGKPPVHTRFQKGQSGNPSGRPGPKAMARRRFAQRLEAALFESTETVTEAPCQTSFASLARGMVLDGLRGKTSTIRLVFDLLDELDGLPPGRRRARIGQMIAGIDDETRPGGDAESLGQAIIEEEPTRLWCEYADEAARSAALAAPDVGERTPDSRIARRSDSLAQAFKTKSHCGVSAGNRTSSNGKLAGLTASLMSCASARDTPPFRPPNAAPLAVAAAAMRQRDILHR